MILQMSEAVKAMMIRWTGTDNVDAGVRMERCSEGYGGGRR